MISRWYEGTWVGFDDRTNEHIVVLKDGGPALKVRTVKPRAEGAMAGQGNQGDSCHA